MHDNNVRTFWPLHGSAPCATPCMQHTARHTRHDKIYAGPVHLHTHVCIHVGVSPLQVTSAIRIDGTPLSTATATSTAGDALARARARANPSERGEEASRGDVEQDFSRKKMRRRRSKERSEEHEDNNTGWYLPSRETVSVARRDRTASASSTSPPRPRLFVSDFWRFLRTRARHLRLRLRLCLPAILWFWWLVVQYSTGPWNPTTPWKNRPCKLYNASINPPKIGFVCECHFHLL